MDKNNTTTGQVISSISHVFYIIKQNIFKKNGIKKIKKKISKADTEHPKHFKSSHLLDFMLRRMSSKVIMVLSPYLSKDRDNATLVPPTYYILLG